MKTNQEKADAFSKTFAKKTDKAVLLVKIKENEVYNGKRKIFQAHEENWLTKQLVEKLKENLNQNIALALTESLWSF